MKLADVHRTFRGCAQLICCFAKMLYDNAQLMRIYAEAFAITKNPLYRFVADGDLPNKGNLRAKVTAQACDDQVCLPPSELQLSIDPSDAPTGPDLK